MESKLLNQLLADVKAAMKDRDNDKVTALRMLHAQIKDATVNAGFEPTDEAVAVVVGKAIKQRQDSLAQFRQGGREDLARKEEREIEWFKNYQPQQLDEAAISQLVREAIAETGAAGKQDMGKVMKALMPRIKGRADGKLVNQIVQNSLG
jgi:hypothetical protein